MGFGSGRHAHPVANTEHHRSAPDCHPNSDSYRHGYCDRYFYCNCYCDRHGDCYRNSYADSHSHTDSEAHASAKKYACTKATGDSHASALARGEHW